MAAHSLTLSAEIAALSSFKSMTVVYQVEHLGGIIISVGNCIWGMTASSSTYGAFMMTSPELGLIFCSS